MFISRVALKNFRNFPSLDMSLNQGFVVLDGPNGAGKTNFLEGIYFGTSLKRFPESLPAQLFREGEPFFKININSSPERLELACEQTDAGYKYRLKLGNNTVSRLKYTDALPVIAFLPQDLNLLTRSPGGRRRFLDETLTLASAEYRHAHGQYTKALKQRNELWQNIKAGQSPLSGLEIWDEQLAEFGSLITKQRKEFIDYLNNNFQSVVSLLSPELDRGRFVYQSSGFWEKKGFLEKFAGARPKEQELATTIVGPHRDELTAQLAGKKAVGFVSRGQLRSMTLALKILEKHYLEEHLQKSPIMLLDDIFSEFDREHQKKLSDFLKTLPQVFITTTHLEEVKEFLPKDSQLYYIERGVITVPPASYV